MVIEESSQQILYQVCKLKNDKTFKMYYFVIVSFYILLTISKSIMAQFVANIQTIL